ncbi:hypothetical protein ACIRPU_23060 [Streptomyces sp. NPDC102259]|uniref:hypothetical protein n=1 Tax=Streptomyces sp. NPDC102259 TaxID=3366148 RepID=UPI00380D4CC9
MIDDGGGLFTIGEPARSTGLTVRTLRYGSPVTAGCRRPPNGLGSRPSYGEEVSWVVAALRAHQGR